MLFDAITQPEPAARSFGRNISLRRGLLDDEPATFEVMRRAMGYEMNWLHHVETRRHLRQAGHSSYWLAEETPRFGRPRVVGYAHSVVRDGVWNLTEFFVLPSHHRQGIGGALLARCLHDGDEAGARSRLVLASTHGGADALYIRQAGCFPRVPMLLLSGPSANLRPPLAESVSIEDRVLPDFSPGFARTLAGQFKPTAPSYTAETMHPAPDVLDELNRLDASVVGYTRPLEHALWMRQMGGNKGAARLFRRRNAARNIVGYAYFGPHSTGPALAVSPTLLPTMLAHVAAVQRQYARAAPDYGFLDNSEPYIALAGTNEAMLGWLLDCGWQIIFQYLFMSSGPLGQLDRYVCHNPLYVL